MKRFAGLRSALPWILGLVLFAAGEGQYPDESEYKLAQTVSSFLGKHMES